MGERLLLKQCLAGMITPTMLECLSIHALVGVCAATRPAEEDTRRVRDKARPVPSGRTRGRLQSRGHCLLLRCSIES